MIEYRFGPRPADLRERVCRRTSRAFRSTGIEAAPSTPEVGARPPPPPVAGAQFSNHSTRLLIGGMYRPREHALKLPCSRALPGRLCFDYVPPRRPRCSAIRTSSSRAQAASREGFALDGRCWRAPACRGAPAADAKLDQGQRPGGHRLRGSNANTTRSSAGRRRPPSSALGGTTLLAGESAPTVSTGSRATTGLFGVSGNDLPGVRPRQRVLKGAAAYARYRRRRRRRAQRQRRQDSIAGGPELHNRRGAGNDPK